MFMFVFISELFLYTWSRVQCVAKGYEIVRETGRMNNLNTLRNNLKIELASLKSPKRIETIATYHIGLKRPDADQMIIVP